MKKNGFFDIKEDEQQEPAASPTVSDVEKTRTEEAGGDAKRQLALILLFTIILGGAFLLLRKYYNSGVLSDSTYYPEAWLTPAQNSNTYKPKLYVPDWESDILNDPEYLELKGFVTYAPNDSVTMGVEEGGYYSAGGDELVFMMKYVDAIIRGDHVTLNSLFNENYFENNDKYEDFPEQRLFNIKIKKYHYADPAYQNSSYDDAYYIITYKIDRNDGLFRDDIDEFAELAQLIELEIAPDGTILIDNIISLPGYVN